jgi:hypothetical protein
VAVSHCRHRVIALSPSHYRIVVIALSHCRLSPSGGQLLTADEYAYGKDLDLIERVHTDFLRKITNSKKSTPIYMLYGELGRYPLEIVIKTRIINYWCKFLWAVSVKFQGNVMSLC